MAASIPFSGDRSNAARQWGHFAICVRQELHHTPPDRTRRSRILTRKLGWRSMNVVSQVLRFLSASPGLTLA